MCADSGAKLSTLLSSLRRQFPAVAAELARECGAGALEARLAARAAG